MNSLVKQLKLRKMDVRFGTWNVRGLNRVGLLMTAVKEISKYKLDLVGIQEIRWDRGRPNQQANIYFSMGMGMRIMNYIQISFT
jgi:exonuclease III